MTPQIISNQQTAERKRQENLAARNYQEVLRVNQATIEDQAAKIARLEAQLEQARLYVELRKAERNVAREELSNVQSQLIKVTEDRNCWRNGCLAAEKKHQKLSGIVKLALTPDEYHRYREIYEDQ